MRGLPLWQHVDEPSPIEHLAVDADEHVAGPPRRAGALGGAPGTSFLSTFAPLMSRPRPPLASRSTAILISRIGSDEARARGERVAGRQPLEACSQRAAMAVHVQLVARLGGREAIAHRPAAEELPVDAQDVVADLDEAVLVP